MKTNEDPKQKYKNKNKLFRFLLKLYERFIKIRGEPRKIALGLALGLFIAMSPTMGLQIPIAVIIAALLKWNKFSAAAGVWITNPVTAPLFYGATYFLGKKLLGIGHTYSPTDGQGMKPLSILLHKAPDALWAMIIGGVILGIPIALAGYYFAYSAIKRYQDDIKRKLARQRERLAERKERRKRKKSGEDTFSKGRSEDRT
ncbi:DUF2062 domain-containing protein [Thermodesulfobacteriota bacterium]